MMTKHCKLFGLGLIVIALGIIMMIMGQVGVLIELLSR